MVNPSGVDKCDRFLQIGQWPNSGVESSFHMPRTTVDLSVEDLKYIEEEIAATRGNSASEIIALALKDYRRARASDELDRLIDEAIESGESIEINPEYWAKKKQALLSRARAAAK
jgi:Arc/MetJ-type ribon-helix-helix transcriptional regulator